jgi:hypothetical protein
MPTFKVEIGWNAQIAGVITFDFTPFTVPVPYTVTTKALTSNVATLTIGTHALVAGDTIGVQNVDATFNGTFVVTATTSTTVSYAKTAGNVTATAATGTAGRLQTGTDTFSNAFTNFFTGAYDDVTADVDSIRIRRGRDDLLSQMNAGTCELEVRRPSDRAYWNPANRSSLLNSANVPGFVPMRPIRITAAYGGTTYGLFWGFLRSARFSYETGVCRLSCVDLLVFMQRTAPLDPALSTTQGGTGSSSYTPDTVTAQDVSNSVTSARSKTGFVRTAA